MFNDSPDDARSEQQLQGAGWLVNCQEGLFIQIKPDTSIQHAQFVVLSTFRWSPVLGNPVRQQRVPRHLGLEMWSNLQEIGWTSCSPPKS